jgi:hypothetical protein
MSPVSSNIGPMLAGNPAAAKAGARGDASSSPSFQEEEVLVVLLVVLAIVVAGLPLTAVVLVTVACWREESARSMAGRAPGQLARAARQLLAFSAVGISRPASRDRTDSPGAAGRPLARTGPGH